MADRFPSLEEFDTAQANPTGVPAFETSAANEDFLTREKALLGEDAIQFSTGNDNFDLMGDVNDDLLGGEVSRPPESIKEESAFENSFPAIHSRDEKVITDGTITAYQSYQASSFSEEPEVIRLWRESRDLTLSERAARSEELKQDTIKKAQQNIDEFYENYNTKKEKSIAQTRREADEFLAKREDTSTGGTSWERIAKLVDLSGKGVKGGASGTDKARFRDLLISLKKDANAPGASGY